MTSRFESILNRIQNAYEIGDTTVTVNRDFVLGHSYVFENTLFTATISYHCDGITSGYYRIEMTTYRDERITTSCWSNSVYADRVRELINSL